MIGIQAYIKNMKVNYYSKNLLLNLSIKEKYVKINL